MPIRERIVAEIKKLGEKLGRAPSQAEFRREARISWHQVYKHFGGMRAAVRAAGLEPGPKGGPLDERALVLDWARVVRELGRLPSRAEYDARGKHHSVTLHARVGWHQMGHRFVLMLREFHLEAEWKDVEQIVVRKYPLLERSIQHSAVSLQPQDIWAENRKRVSRELTRMDTNPMRLGRVVAAALAIEILMAAERSIQQSALSHQQETGNWPLANSNWKNQDQNQDKDQNQPPEPQRTPVRLPAVAQGRLRNTEAEEHLAIEEEAPRDPSARARVPPPQQMQTAHLLGAPAPVPQKTADLPVVYGEPLGLAAMAHAPTNEDGVLFLFGVVAPELGFRVERIQRAFPDVEAKREVAPGRWERQLWELELYSRNFKEHKHDPKGCHGIICWKHNWPDVPEELEVIELSRVVKGRQS
jgi:hypothetical protein